MRILPRSRKDLASRYATNSLTQDLSAFFDSLTYLDTSDRSARSLIGTRYKIRHGARNLKGRTGEVLL